jgi:hypothetical protein
MRIVLFSILCFAFIVGCEQKQGDNSQGGASRQQQVVTQTKDRLLHSADPQILLAAFREVMHTRKNFQKDPRWNVHGGDAAEVEASVSFIQPNDTDLPPVIRGLRADGIRCYDDHLDIVVGGEQGSLGFVAGAEGFTNIAASVSGAKIEKVIDGLWFYEVRLAK